MRVCLLLAASLALLACQQNRDARVHIRIWHQKIAGERDLFNEEIGEFNAHHPDVVVEALYKENEELRNLFVIAAVAGQGPDVVYGPADNIGVMVTTKTILPLEKIFAESFFARFSAGGVIQWQGSRWLVADQIGNHLTLIYNTTLVSRPPETLDELIAMGRLLTKHASHDRKIEQYGLTWNYREPFFFIPFLTGFGGWVMDKDARPTLDTPEMVRALQFVIDLRDKYQIIPKEGDYDVADMLFKENRTAMIINGPWSWSSYHVPDRAKVAPLPKNTETGYWCEPMVSAKGYSVNAAAAGRKLPAIRELIDFLTSDEVQRKMAAELSTSPVSLAAIDSPEVRQNPTLIASMAQIEHGRAMPIVPQMRAIWEAMRGPYQLLMNGAITPQEAARRMQREAEKNIAESSL
ncbi:MAG: extracellular solute-binding protein [Verrucomicrobia bacterium]|nr:extracellular solute-binding protein [Verrucomicrobiota bacterium]